jgi:hypothetical protein
MPWGDIGFTLAFIAVKTAVVTASAFLTLLFLAKRYLPK